MSGSVFNRLVVLTTCALITATASIIPPAAKETRAICGGALEGDTGTLTYLNNTPLSEETHCIWTIQLKSTSMFRLAFGDFDITSNTSTCDDSAVRIYPLNNLLPPSRFDGQTFCNDKPPTGSGFYLPESLVAVVYHSSHSSATKGSGFVLHWEGISPNPYPKTHESTISSASSGFIKYPPLGGGYAADSISTWVVQPSTALNVTPLVSQLKFSNVRTEACSRGNPEDCLCDAVILYELKSDGSLAETSRLCGNNTSQSINKFSSNFILGFFSDHETTDGDEQGTGFELVYSPRIEPPKNNVSRICGGVLEGTSGLIEYKSGQPLGLEEHCLWTIRSPSRTQIKLTLHEIGLDHWPDVLEYVAMSSSEAFSKYSFNKADVRREITINATVAIVSLFTWYLPGSSTGFSLSFEVGEVVDSNLGSYNDFHYNMGTYSCGGSLRYQPEQTVWANGIELSTFTIQHTSTTDDGYRPVELNITEVSLRENPSTGNCTDKIRLFYLDHNIKESIPYAMPAGVCRMDMALPEQERWGEYLWSDGTAIIFLFAGNKDSSELRKEKEKEDFLFEVNWRMTYSSNVVCNFSEIRTH